MKYSKARTLARNNRKHPTHAERLFWQVVRNRNFNGLKFNRQFLLKYKLNDSVDNYFIADFYCHEKRLIVEIDGEIHKEKKLYDHDRSRIISSMGIRIIRFENDDIIYNLDIVIQRLEREIN